MKFTYTVPARKVTLEILWLKDEFLAFTKRFQEIRPKSKCCWKCHAAFQENQMMGLISIEGKGNKLLCPNCVALIRKELK